MKLSDVKGISVNRLNALLKAGIHSVQDLLDFFPRRYEDKSNILSIGLLRGQGEQVTVRGTITSVNEIGHGRRKRLEVIISDQTGTLKGVWFKGLAYQRKILNPGAHVSFYGTAKRFGSMVSMAHPDVEVFTNQDAIPDKGVIQPIYASTNFFTKTYITSKIIQKWILEILPQITITEFLPKWILDRFGFPNRAKAYRMIHAPESEEEYQLAQYRFKFEELYLFELSVTSLKLNIIEKRRGPILKELQPLTSTFFNTVLPFELTDGQKSALHDIKRDVQSGKQMNRLIQGDVGSGKTVVALGAILMALDNGYQSVFMAPTEILAEQHYHTLTAFLKNLDVEIRLLTGNQKPKHRKEILAGISGGQTQIIVGTHAIIQKEVVFNNLGMAIVDEQHRFGVEQRAYLRDKGNNPHILVMSATPIPRSLAMTLYSDLSISLIKGLPGGRKPIRTAVRTEQKRDDVYEFIDDILNGGGQVYIVYPLVEESEALDLKDATEGFKNVRARFEKYRCGLLHGRMKSEEKEDVMRQFMSNEIQVLVSTTVIEVGVDVPNASIMMVEHAERFGLAQLHQLRGRIGRGSRQSYCILMAGEKQSKEARIRLQTMASTNDGFKIAEQDLKLRGPGDFLGTRQSGLPEFKLADIIEDQGILEEAKNVAIETIQKDPDLKLPEHEILSEVFAPYLEQKKKYYQMS